MNFFNTFLFLITLCTITAKEVRKLEAVVRHGDSYVMSLACFDDITHSTTIIKKTASYQDINRVIETIKSLLIEDIHPALSNPTSYVVLDECLSTLHADYTYASVDYNDIVIKIRKALCIADIIEQDKTLAPIAKQVRQMFAKALQI